MNKTSTVHSSGKSRGRSTEFSSTTRPSTSSETQGQLAVSEGGKKSKRARKNSGEEKSRTRRRDTASCHDRMLSLEVASWFLPEVRHWYSTFLTVYTSTKKDDIAPFKLQPGDCYQPTWRRSSVTRVLWPPLAALKAWLGRFLKIPSIYPSIRYGIVLLDRLYSGLRKIAPLSNWLERRSSLNENLQRKQNSPFPRYFKRKGVRETLAPERGYGKYTSNMAAKEMWWDVPVCHNYGGTVVNGKAVKLHRLQKETKARRICIARPRNVRQNFSAKSGTRVFSLHFKGEEGPKPWWQFPSLFPSKPVQESLLRWNRPLPNRSRGSTTSSKVQTCQELAEYSSSTKQAVCNGSNVHHCFHDYISTTSCNFDSGGISKDGPRDKGFSFAPILLTVAFKLKENQILHRIRQFWDFHGNFYQLITNNLPCYH